MANHVEFAHDPYLAWRWHLIAEQLCILCNRHIEPGRRLVVLDGTWQMNSLHFPLEQGMPMTEMLQKRLIIHVAGDFMLHHDLSDAAHYLNSPLVWSRHYRPKARLVEEFGDSAPQPRSPDVKNRLPAPLAK